MNEKKIIFVHFNNGYTGSPMVLRTVIESFDNKRCLLITNKTDGFLSDINISTVKFNFTLSESKLITLYKYFLAQFVIFFIVLRMCRRNDILYINTTIHMFASFAGKIKGTKTIFHLHEDRSSLNFVHRFLSSFRKYFCDIEIFVSKYLLSKEHIKGKKCFVLYNVVPLAFYEEGIIQEVTQLKDGFFNVLMICSLKKYKGVFELLRIAENLYSYKKIKFTLLVSEDRMEINRFFNEVSIPHNLIVHERNSDTIPFYKNASILINLSRPDEWIETYGLTILEGMIFGLPCIVPPVGGPLELIDEGVNGYRISSYEIESISKKILLLYNDENLYYSIAKNNKKKSEKYQFGFFKSEVNEIIDNAFSK